MNYTLIFFLSSFIFVLTTKAQVTLYYQDFEGADFDTYTLFDGMPTAVPFNQTTDNYIVRAAPNSVPVGNTISGFTGKVIAVEDTDDAGFFGEPYILTNSFSISGYTNISIQIKFAAGSGADGSIYETSDFIDVDYRLNGSGAWYQAHKLEGSASGKFWFDADNNGVTETGDDINIDQNAQNLEQSFIVTGSSMELRIRMGSWGDDEEMMFDDILVEAIVPCSPAVITSLNATSTEICMGDSTNISVVGMLNDDTVWHLYEDGCGTTPISSDASGMFEVNPTNNTTYYIRGEDGVGCINEATLSCNSISIIVNPLPSISLSTPPSLCANEELNSNLSGGFPLGGIYSGPGCIDDGNGSTYSIEPSIAGVGTHIITYEFSDSNACFSVMQNSFTIYGLPAVSIVDPGDFCDNLNNQTGLAGSNPIGGVFSGIGVTDDGNGLTYSFDPGFSGAGNRFIYYEYSDSNNCVVLDSVSIEVFSAPSLIGNGRYSFCMDSSEIIITGGVTPHGGVYGGSSIVDNSDGLSYMCNTILAGPGQHLITYNLADSNGCIAWITDTLDLIELPNILAGNDQTLCIGDSAILTGSGGLSYLWNNGVLDGGYFTPAPGMTSYILTGTGVNGCINYDTVAIIVNTLPTNTVTQIGSTLLADNVNAEYQWVHCDSSMLSIIDDTAQLFEPTLNGNYAVILYENGCSDTSNCFSINTLTLDSHIEPLNFLLFPNPCYGPLNLRLNNMEDGLIRVYTLNGRLVFTSPVNDKYWSKDLSFLNSGIYIFELSKNEHFGQKILYFHN
ncbi:T9SS type A sorting domain-containing protein [Flavobacteriales bacterium]|nr:T9SS type A sorting domain-containing protein [Flavobacteriales bacterium]